MINDDSNLWFETQGQQIQDYEVPTDPIFEAEAEPAEILDEPQPEITDAEVRSQINLQRINKPVAGLIVGGMDAVIPLLFIALVKGTEEDDLKLTPQEREDLENAFALYLGEKSIEVNPFYALLFTIATIYGGKMMMAIRNKKLREEKAELQAEIERQRVEIQTLRDMMAKQAEENEKKTEKP
ncbi:MAG: hypothetical protein IKX51_08745 [Bacteroidales bacterium]|nr:hypothetical protein [Bacteroidales bacterium]